ncbi:MAG: hypothetical protein V7727_20390 [Sneathiella sp.]
MRFLARKMLEYKAQNEEIEALQEKLSDGHARILIGCVLEPTSSLLEAGSLRHRVFTGREHMFLGVGYLVF